MAHGPWHTLRQSLLVGSVTLVTVAVILYLFGFQMSVVQFVALLIVFAMMSVVMRRTAEVTVGFTILTLGILFLLADYVIPSELIAPFTVFRVLIDDAIGIDVADIDGFAFLVLSSVFVFVMLFVRIRVTGERRFTREAFDLTLARFTRFVDIYLTTGRLIALFLFTVVVIFSTQLAMFLGQAGNTIAEVPFVALNIFTAVTGFLSLGGSLPIIGEIEVLQGIDPVVWGVGIAILFAIAVAVRWEGSGPLSQYLNR